MDSATWVQAIATLVLVAITGYYAWQTKKMVEQSGPTPWIEPTSFIDVLGHRVRIAVKNYGPGHAVLVKANVNSKVAVGPIAADGTVEVDPDLKAMDGPSTIHSGSSGVYVLEDARGPAFIAAKSELVLSWQSVTGANFMRTWQSIDSNKWRLTK